MKSVTVLRRLSEAHDLDALHRLQDQSIQSAATMTPPRFEGDGIVLVAGGARCFTNAFVAIVMLRRELRCSLPIQIWYLGPDEMTPAMMRLLDPFDVEFVDAFQVRERYPARTLGGWECKAYAILHSRFKRVILLDADNVALADPAPLLAAQEFADIGAIFWPDQKSLPPQSPIWDLCQVPFRDEPEVESGQLVIDKERCWVPLNLAMHFNEWSDVYYRYFYGDKEAFHLAWRRVDQPYAMPEKRPHRVFGSRDTPTGPRRMVLALEHHDFAGRRLFHHRTGAEWVLFGENPPIGRPEMEEKCLAILSELREQWDGRVSVDPHPEDCLDGRNIIATRRYRYRRVGVDERLIEFEADGRIGLGAAANEVSWRVETSGGSPTLIISRRDGDICRLVPDGNGVWRGAWLWYERMPVEMIPVGVTCPAS